MAATETVMRQAVDADDSNDSLDDRKAAQTGVLFQPWTIGQHKLKHRIVYAPLTRCRALEPGNVPGENMLEYYSQRARGCEGGFLIAEATVISSTGHGCDAEWSCQHGLAKS